MSGNRVPLALRRPWHVLVAAAVVAVVAAVFGVGVFDRLSVGGTEAPRSEATRAADALRSELGREPGNLVLLVTAKEGVDDPGAARAGTALTRRLAAEPGLSEVASYWTLGRPQALRSTDGDKALVTARITGGESEADHRVHSLIPRYSGERDGLRVSVGGPVAVLNQFNETTEHDAKIAEGITLPFVLLVLVLVFGSVVAALLPLSVSIVVLLTGLLTLWSLSHLTDVSAPAVNVVSMLSLGLAIDYNLLIVSRYREELKRGTDRDQALRTTIQTAGRTVVFSALTVALAIGVLTVFPFQLLRSIAVASVATAVSAAAVSVLVTPALLRLLGPRIERWRLIRPRREREVELGRWHGLALLVMRHPVAVAAVTIPALLALGLPFTGARLGMMDEAALPADTSAAQVAQTIRHEFGALEQDALQVVSQNTGGRAAALPAYATTLSRLPTVARVDAVTGTYSKGALAAPPTPASTGFVRGDAAYVTVTPAAGTDSAQARDLVRQIRSTPAPFPVMVGGAPAEAVDTLDALSDTLPLAAALLAIVLFVLLFLLTGSVVMPLVGLVLTALSLTATFGALVWIFQDGHLRELLGGFVVTGEIAWTIPLLMFAMAFGLAMDYQVFLLSRIKEEYERTGRTTDAAAIGLERVGRVVTAAALLMAIVFFAFMTAGSAFAKAMGFGLGLAVLIDATVVRGLLLPAIVRLGRRSLWWAPGPLRTLHAAIGIREGGPPHPPLEAPTTAAPQPRTASTAPREKIAATFALYDLDDSGTITRRDFKLLSQRIEDALFRPDGRKAPRLLTEAIALWWHRLRVAADFDEDQRVTPEEYTDAMLTGVLDHPAHYQETVDAVLAQILQAIAPSGALTGAQCDRVLDVLNLAPGQGRQFLAGEPDPIDHDRFRALFAANLFGMPTPRPPQKGTAMEPTIQEKNIATMFGLFDTDGNGVIERRDFELLGEGACDAFALDPESPKANDLNNGFMAWWDQLRVAADADGDGRITRAEFTAAIVEGALADPHYLDAVITALARAFVRAVDTGDEGRIDRDAFTRMYQSCGLSAEIAHTAFDTINVNGTVDEDTFAASVRDVFGSTDINAPGTAIFGQR
ncbi:MMPL family transporter [Actinomadura sp. 1N219]|uniref:MMPL family transporter n=1 Tax=Actinomadura sp. 1N219 TaxID=3375152 RepID=UPI003798E504